MKKSTFKSTKTIYYYFTHLAIESSIFVSQRVRLRVNVRVSRVFVYNAVNVNEIIAFYPAKLPPYIYVLST